MGLEKQNLSSWSHSWLTPQTSAMTANLKQKLLSLRFLFSFFLSFSFCKLYPQIIDYTHLMRCCWKLLCYKSLNEKTQLITIGRLSLTAWTRVRIGLVFWSSLHSPPPFYCFRTSFDMDWSGLNLSLFANSSRIDLKKTQIFFF